MEQGSLPKHIAIIMDGNGRWAQKRGLPRVMGHRQGIQALKRTLEEVVRLGIPFLTVYAFSTENWQRPKEEVSYLMGLIEEYMKKEIHNLERNNIKIKLLGSLDPLPQKARAAVEEALERTAKKSGTTLSVALNYGGRAELVRAAKKLAQAVSAGELDLENIDEELFAAQLDSAPLPDPDLLIRTGGQMRISNFLLWQLAYTELWVTPKLWPDFTAQDLQEAIEDYRRRTRRFGKI
jgi:undecaprenyl diphosphate synthase